MLTFRKIYNIVLHPKTIMGAYELFAKGGDIASCANNHLDVYDAIAGGYMRKLSEITGKSYYRNRADEHDAFIRQLICLIDGHFNGFKGAITEQFYWCNWPPWGQVTLELEDNGFEEIWEPGVNSKPKGANVWIFQYLVYKYDTA